MTRREITWTAVLYLVTAAAIVFIWRMATTTNWFVGY